MRSLFTTGALIATFALTSAASATVLFEEGFSSGANVITTQIGQNEISYIDYSNFKVGSTSYKLSEATKGKGTSGVLIRSNVNKKVTSAVQFFAKGANGNAKSFSGKYTVSWDVFQNTTVPLPKNGSTEWSTWGVGNNDATKINGYANKRYNGTWGLALTGGDFKTWDYRVCVDDKIAASISNETKIAKKAFPKSKYGIEGTPLGAWTHWELAVANGKATLSANGVKIFSNISTTSTDGFAYIGYADRYSSVNSAPEATWAILDNFVITDGEPIPEPA